MLTFLQSVFGTDEQETIDHAIAILDDRAKKSGFGVSRIDAEKLFRLHIGAQRKEYFAVAYLDSGLRLLSTNVVGIGGTEQVYLDTLSIVREALTLSAYGVIISHNHPSGNLTPSEADIEITREIKSMLGQFDINLVDHIIVTTGGGYSFEDKGIL